MRKPRFAANDPAELRLDKLAGTNSGTIVRVVRQLDASEADEEVGPMYEITLHVFEEELKEYEP